MNFLKSLPDVTLDDVLGGVCLALLIVGGLYCTAPFVDGAAPAWPELREAMGK